MRPAKEVTGRLRAIQKAIVTFRSTTLAEVEKERDPFRLLVACVISLRTKDSVTAESARRLFEKASDAGSLARLGETEIAKRIYPAGFYRTKARQLRAIAQAIDSRPKKDVPGSLEELLELPGVGRKTANLVLGLGYGIPAICVDTHVHRIPNRWGWIRTGSPAETESALRDILPKRWWIPVNDLLVTFGQNICLPVSPLCGRCPVEPECPKTGVGKRR